MWELSSSRLELRRTINYQHPHPLGPAEILEMADLLPPEQAAIPREVGIAIRFQTALFLLGVLLEGFGFIRKVLRDDPHTVTSAVAWVLVTALWWLWLRGLWSRRNWVRWLTIISNICILCFDLLILVAESGRWRDQPLLRYFLITAACLQIVLAGPATVMFLRPVARDWYRSRLAGARNPSDLAV